MEAQRCWVCGRTAEEIQSSLDGKTDAEKEIDAKIDALGKEKSSFEKLVNPWQNKVPSEFAELEFAFVLGNPEQFKSIGFLRELAVSSKTIMDELEEMSYRVAIGDDHDEITIKRLKNFEKKHQRTLKRKDTYRRSGYDEQGYPEGFDGLKLRNGIDYLVSAGLFLYDLRAEDLERAKQDAIGKRPVWRVGTVKFNDFPKEVPLCTVCERLMKSLHPVEYDDD